MEATSLERAARAVRIEQANVNDLERRRHEHHLAMVSISSEFYEANERLTRALGDLRSAACDA